MRRDIKSSTALALFATMLIGSMFVFAASSIHTGTLCLGTDCRTSWPSGAGSGTTDYTARWTNSTTLGVGILQDNGTTVGIATAPSAFTLDVGGTVHTAGVMVGSYSDFSASPCGSLPTVIHGIVVSC